MLPPSATPAFTHLRAPIATPILPQRFCSHHLSRRRPPRASGLDSLPFGTIIVAGVSVGILSATFENMLKVLYRRRPRRPSDDELCAYCSGFGNVRCQICGSTGVLFIMGTSVERECPACKGNKWERCRRCSGSGKSGMKKVSSQVKENYVR